MDYSFLMTGGSFSTPLLLLILAWTLPWKGVALWKAANNKHKWWFIAILILNTLAILEIIYIFIFAKKKEKTENV
jgi:hypothetical protein